MPWRAWIGIVLLATALHGQAIVRTRVPAQDGLKYIRAARAFQTKPWLEAIRGTDQHPLYPMAIATVQPVVRVIQGDSPASWRIAAQLVSVAASLILLIPLYLLTREQFGDSAGLFAALLFVALPIPAEVGHDTLADALALLCFTLALWQGARWLECRQVRPALGAGVAAGLGFWTRPELAVVGLVLIAMTGGLALRSAIGGQLRSAREVGDQGALRGRTSVAAACLAIGFLGLVGVYSVAKGELSEKLAVRLGMGLPPSAAARVSARSGTAALEGLPPKEESTSAHPHPTLGWACRETGALWLRTIGVLLAPLALVGAFRAPPSATRTVMRAYCLVFVALLLRHASTRGYLSHRHVLTLVIVCLPWAGWRYHCLLQRVGDWLRLRVPGRRCLAAVFVAAIVLPAVVAQSKPIHPSRWGHWAAGQWLASHADRDDAVLDTRGWAGFLSGRVAYGPWHVRQALADARLRFIVLEQRELEAGTDRANRLKAWIEPNGRQVAGFAAQESGSTAEVLVFRYEPAADRERQP